MTEFSFATLSFVCRQSTQLDCLPRLCRHCLCLAFFYELHLTSCLLKIFHPAAGTSQYWDHNTASRRMVSFSLRHPAVRSLHPAGDQAHVNRLQHIADKQLDYPTLYWIVWFKCILGGLPLDIHSTLATRQSFYHVLSSHTQCRAKCLPCSQDALTLDVSNALAADRSFLKLLQQLADN